MNLQDRLAEIILPILDTLMNILTLGLWGSIQGNKRPSLKIRK